MTPFKALALSAGGLTVAAVAAYFAGAFDPYLPDRPAAVASLPDEGAGTAEEPPRAGRDDAPAKAENAAGDARAGNDKTANEEAGNEEAGDAVIVPVFDIVRVEPDGSTVIAGRAAPDARVEIVSGATVLGETQSGPSGDFAAVLDDPLEPGDYQIVLRATTQGDVAATSVETALVTVPDEEGGQTLALVDKPGAPSRLITVPKAGAAPDKDDGRDGDKARNRNANGNEDRDVEAPAVAGGQSQSVAAGDTPGAETASAGTAQTAAADTPAARQAPVAPAGGEEGAAPFIEAVEIDGNKVFVAGTAKPGRRVRVYANDLLLGDAETAPNGRFLVEALRELPLGDYIVRADLLADDGRSVVARAAVPFTRRAGEKVAAVAGDKAARPGGAGPKGDRMASAGAPAGAAATEEGRVDGEQVASNGGAVPPLADDGQAPAGDGAAQTVSPKLEPVDGAVIIRRGDTLWHISRRVYGQGIRYTTIYLANQDQIRDPDLIWPGQVFAVPDQTAEGERADLEAIGEQAVPTP